MISRPEIRFLLMRGSSIAVNKVSEEKHTRATETVDNLMDKKNSIQCAPTSAPVKASLKKAALLTLNSVRLNLK